MKEHPADGTKPALKFKTAGSPATLFKNIAQVEELKEISKIYGTYQWYSKYDHFGILYFELLHEPIDKKIDQLLKTVPLLIRHWVNIYGFLERFNPQDEDITNEYKTAANYMLQSLGKPLVN